MSASASLHWLLEPHLVLMEHLQKLEKVVLLTGLTLVPVMPQYVASFVACEHSLRERRVGPALQEHLERFGASFAAMAIDNEIVVGCIRARIFHEFDPSMKTILVSFLGVSPSHRNRGIGSSLVCHLAQYFLVHSRVHCVSAEVAEDNYSSQKYFQIMALNWPEVAKASSF